MENPSCTNFDTKKSKDLQIRKLLTKMQWLNKFWYGVTMKVQWEKQS